MKISVSVSASEAAMLDEYARSAGLTRSAAVQQAIRLLRHADLEADYLVAWAEWESSGERAAWDTTVGDGVLDASR